MCRTLSVLALATLFSMGQVARADDSASPTKPALSPMAQALIERQERLRQDFRRFEQQMGSLAQQMERSSNAGDREKAELLNKALKRINEFGIDTRFAKINELLRSSKVDNLDQVSASVLEGEKLYEELSAIYDILSLPADGSATDKKIEAMIAEIKKIKADLALAEALNRLKKHDPAELADREAKIIKDTKKVLDNLKGVKDADAGTSKPNDSANKSNGQEPAQSKSSDPKNSEPSPSDSKGDSKSPSDGGKGDSKGDQSGNAGDPSASKPKPSAGGDDQPKQPKQPELPGQQEVKDAIDLEKIAKDNLDKRDTDGGADNNAAAKKKLDEAQKKLEEILRQRREDEIARKLLDLQHRCEAMLARETEVYHGTVDTNKTILALPEKKPTRAEETASQGLSDRQGQIAKLAVDAIALIEADGTGQAYAESFRQLRDDMLAVQRLLTKVQVGEFTQQSEQDIIDMLKQMIEDLKEEQKKQAGGGGGGGGGGGQPPKKPLVSFVQELKRVRAMQDQVNKRTESISKAFPGVESPESTLPNAPEIRQQLQNLAERQASLKKITKDLNNDKATKQLD